MQNTLTQYLAISTVAFSCGGVFLYGGSGLLVFARLVAALQQVLVAVVGVVLCNNMGGYQ
ncbi:MAG TPA: hypothetical protein PK230_15430 [Chitinophagales bacterium]|nr:hypothetical protein [Chitinophagales bacterium]